VPDLTAVSAKAKKEGERTDFSWWNFNDPQSYHCLFTGE